MVFLPLTFPAGVLEEKNSCGAPEWNTSCLMVLWKKFSGRARRVHSRARPISCRQVLRPVPLLSRFATAQFVRDEECWLADPVVGGYGWLQVNDVKKIGSTNGQLRPAPVPSRFSVLVILFLLLLTCGELHRHHLRTLSSDYLRWKTLLSGYARHPT